MEVRGEGSRYGKGGKERSRGGEGKGRRRQMFGREGKGEIYASIHQGGSEALSLSNTISGTIESNYLTKNTV
jgi:hypothetical protein